MEGSAFVPVPRYYPRLVDSKRVYEESNERYAKLLAELTSLRQRRFRILPTARPRAPLTAPPSTKEGLIKKDDAVYEAIVPAYGAAELIPYEDKGCMKADEDTLESDFSFIVKFDQNGNISSLFSKELNKEFCGDYLNKLNVYKDKRMFYDAWDIDINYAKKRPQAFKLLDFSFKVYPLCRKREYL